MAGEESPGASHAVRFGLISKFRSPMVDFVIQEGEVSGSGRSLAVLPPWWQVAGLSENADTGRAREFVVSPVE